ncbi:hypothetical protein M917_0949 [Psychrobacter aquaticus CMS 56]|uniref:Uncharacterized protein n=1 Tax=Psychrobacter aquaticus CMS 56 TaxID=1354303 RepID=U4T7Z9_9GAMM|nr:hypothetical protein M917_0949 [Psychrobacter aquaticus CMS 56]
MSYAEETVEANQGQLVRTEKHKPKLRVVFGLNNDSHSFS